MPQPVAPAGQRRTPKTHKPAGPAHSSPRQRAAAPKRTPQDGGPAPVFAPLSGLRGPQDLINLQRLVGNQATIRSMGTGHTVQRQLIQRKTEKEKFMAKTFKKKGFIPSTGIGNFDVEYSPKKGAMKVIVKLHFDFQDVDNAWKSEANDPADTKWKSAQKKQWVKDFKTKVLEVWGDIGQINCKKPGWEDITVKPAIVIEEVGKGKGNYNVKVDKAFITKGGKMRTSQGSTSVGGLDREKEAAFQEQDNKDKINDPKVKGHLSGAERAINIEPALKRDQQRLDECLAAVRKVMFRPGEATLDGGFQALVQKVAQALVALRKDSALAKLHPLKIIITLADGEGGGLGDQRFEAIKAVLVGAGVPNQINKEVVQGRNGSGQIARGDDAGVSDAYLAHWKRLTVAHEFGHMLGLLDEYCPAVSPDLLEMMVQEGKLKPGYVMSGMAQGKVAQDSDKQTAYSKMLKANKLETPTWARPTSETQEKSTSIMSGGFEVLTQHYVTIWEGLGAATTPTVTKEEWQLA
jgi:hypothetical protein